MGTDAPNSLSSFLHSTKNGLFSALGIMAKKPHANAALAITGIIVKMLQIIAFLFISQSYLWTSNSAAIAYVSLVPSPAGWLKIITAPYTAYYVLFYISLVWALVFVILMLWAIRAFTRGFVPVLWPLRLLSNIGTFSATVAYVPLTTLLLSVHMCTGNDEFKAFWVASDGTCFTGSHLVLSIISTILAVAFVALASLFALVFFDPHPLTANLAGKAHGRVDFILLLLKTLLVITLEIVPTTLGGPWVTVGINVGVGAAAVLVCYYFMPYTHHSMNQLLLASFCIYLWGGICLIIQQAAPTVDASLLLYVGLPAAVGSGVLLANHRRTYVRGMPVSNMRSVYEVELKTRYTLELHVDAALQASVRAGSTAFSVGMTASSVPSHPESTSLLKGGSESMRGGTTGGIAGVDTESVTLDSNGDHSEVSVKNGMGGTPSKDTVALMSAAYRSMDNDSRASIMRDFLPKAAITEMDSALREATLRFPTSPMLHVFQARFYSTFTASKHLNVSHLLMANRLDPGIDVAFLAFQVRRAAESGGAHSSALQRVSFDKHLADARNATLRAARAQVKFWMELSDPTPDISVLHTIPGELAEQTRLAEEHFKEAFALHPQSLPALRLYAQYNASVANNQEKAIAIASEADRLEDQRTKDSSGQMNSSMGKFDLFVPVNPDLVADAPACITVGASSRDVGLILSVNSSACKMLGYSRTQLERRNINIIIPQPFSGQHDGYMRRYLSTGEGQFLETALVSLAVHKNGYLIPIILFLRESILSDGTNVFTATVRNLPMSEHFVLMDSQLKVLGGSPGALMHMNLEAQALNSMHEVNMQDYCPWLSIPQKVEALLQKAGAEIIPMTLPGLSSAGSSTSRSAVEGRAPGPERHSSTASDGASVHGRSPVSARKRRGENMEATEVKAALQRTVLQGTTVYILTWRLLTVSEVQVQANAVSARRFSQAIALRASAERSQEEGSETPSQQWAAAMSSEEANVEQSFSEDKQEAGKAGKISKGVVFRSALNILHGDQADMSGAKASLADADDSNSTDAGSRGSSDVSAFSEGPLKPFRHGGSSPVPAGHDGMPHSHPFSLKVGACPAGFKAAPAKDAADKFTSPALTAKTEGSEASAPPPPTQLTTTLQRRPSDGGRSGHSGGSRSSATRRGEVTKGTISRLRKVLVDSNFSSLRRSVSGVGMLYYTGIAVLILNISLSGLALWLLISGFNVLTSNLRFASIAGEAVEFQARSMRCVHKLTLFQRGWAETRNLVDLAGLRRDINSQSTLLVERVQQMYALVVGTPSEPFFKQGTFEYIDFFSNPTILPPNSLSDEQWRTLLLSDTHYAESRMDGSIIVARKATTNFLTYTTRLAAVMKEIFELPLANCSADDPRILFVVANGHPGAWAHERLKAAFLQAYEVVGDTTKFVNQLVVYCFWSMGVGFCLIVLIIVIPILWRIERGRDEIMKSFLDVPLPVVNELRLQSERRMRAFRAEDDEEDHDDSEDEEEDEARLMMSREDEAEEEQKSDNDASGEGYQWDTLFQKAQIDANRERKKLLALTSPAAPPASRPDISPHAVTCAPRCVWCARCCSRRSQPASPAASAPTDVSAAASAQPATAQPTADQSTTAQPVTYLLSRREHRKRGLGSLALTGFLLPVLVMCCFYLALWLRTEEITAVVQSLALYTTISSLRFAATRSLRTMPYWVISKAGYPAETVFRYEMAAQEIVNMKARNNLLAFSVVLPPVPWVMAGITTTPTFTDPIGSETTDIPWLSESIKKSMVESTLGQACPFITLRVAVEMPPEKRASTNLTRCLAFDGQVFTGGIRSAMDRWLGIIERINERRLYAQVPPGSSTGRGVLRMPQVADFPLNVLDAQANDDVLVYKALQGRGCTTDGITTVRLGGLYSAWRFGKVSMSLTELLNTLDQPCATTGIREGAANVAFVESPYSLIDELRFLNPGLDRGVRDTPDWFVDRYVTDYLGPAFLWIAETYGRAGIDVTGSYQVFIQWFVGTYIVVFFLGMVALYLPAVVRLSRDVHTKRVMLLLLPPAVTTRVPSLKAMVVQIVTELDSGGLRPAASQSKGDGMMV